MHVNYLLKEIFVDYGSGDINGVIVQDSINLNQFIIAQNQSFILTNQALNMPTLSFSGLVGMGSNLLSDSFTTLIQNL
jgi:hypothetical protein